MPHPLPCTRIFTSKIETFVSPALEAIMVAKLVGAIQHFSAIIFFCLVGLRSTSWIISIFRFSERLYLSADAIAGLSALTLANCPFHASSEKWYPKPKIAGLLRPDLRFLWTKLTIRCNRRASLRGDPRTGSL